MLDHATFFFLVYSTPLLDKGLPFNLLRVSGLGHLWRLVIEVDQIIPPCLPSFSFFPCYLIMLIPLTLYTFNKTNFNTHLEILILQTFVKETLSHCLVHEYVYTGTALQLRSVEPFLLMVISDLLFSKSRNKTNSTWLCKAIHLQITSSISNRSALFQPRYSEFAAYNGPTFSRKCLYEATRNTCEWNASKLALSTCNSTYRCNVEVPIYSFEYILFHPET